ncbi:Pancreatic progenitor cell differentiation and proliferation factor, partial [Myotis davidii]
TSPQASASLLVTRDYSLCRLGSTDSDSSCGSAACPGKPFPTTKARQRQWRASFFWGKSMPQCWSPPSTRNLPGLQEHITCDLAQEATGKQPGGQPCKATAGPPC